MILQTESSSDAVVMATIRTEAAAAAAMSRASQVTLLLDTVVVCRYLTL